MQYENLTQLLSESSGTRRYFLNLPVDMQLELHKYNDNVRTAHELHEMVEALNRDRHYDAIGGWPHEYSLY